MARKPKPPKKPKGVRERVLDDGTTRYLAYVTVAGKQKALGTCDTFNEAVALRHAYFEALKAKAAETGQVVRMDPGILTVAQLGALCLQAGSEDWDGRRWRRIVETADFAGWPASEVNERHVRLWIAKLAKTPIASGRSAGQRPTRPTVASALSLLRRVYRWGAMPEREYVTHNPAERVTIGESTELKLKTNRNILDYLREDEARAVLESKKLPLRRRAMFVMLMIAGPRPKDLWRLAWDRVDWKAESIRFTSTKTAAEVSSDYTVHPLPLLMAVLREWWLASGRPAHGLIFPAGTRKDGTQKTFGNGYDAGWQDKRERRTRVWYVDNTEDGSLSADSTRPKKATVTGEQGKHLRRLYGERRTSKGELKVTPGWRSKLGITRDVPLYALRHTCACHLLLGTPLFTGGRMWSREEVQAQLGHKSSDATERYMLALGIKARRAAIESRAALKAVKVQNVTNHDFER
jgi:integrase